MNGGDPISGMTARNGNKPVGQGDKYAMVRLLLKEEKGQTVEAFIRAGRRARPQVSYYTLADEINEMFRQRYGNNRDTPRVTWESMRRWDPEGSFQQAARDAQQRTTDTTEESIEPAIPPVQFSEGE